MSDAPEQIQPEIPLNILFVDDEPNILTALRRLLMDEDFGVLTAASGYEGLEVLKTSTEVGVIVSDQRMPGMTGVEFLEQARGVAPQALRILLTGYADMEATIAAINRGGAYRYLTKPWDDQALLMTLREAATQYRLRRENERLNQIVSRQNEELRQWNGRLKSRVLEQTAEIRKKNEELRAKNARLRANYRDTIGALSGLLEMRAAHMRNHARNVCALSLGVAAAMDLPEEQREELQVAALLHDIGEIGTPDGLLRRRAEDLMGEELHTYLQHTVRGQMAIDAIADLRGAGVLIRHHHEHYDGSGYPDGLAGTAIPLGARIIALADFVDRHLPRGTERAADLVLTLLQPHLGTRFDTSLYPYFDQVVRAHYGPPVEAADMEPRLLRPGELRCGMVLNDDLVSSTGLLLLSRNAVLDEAAIAAIHRYHELDPFRRGIGVLVKKR
ncbi:HD domain-containing phosphohydrolase [Geoalkalibacter halelectricus]|uniref:Response regulator n=1 Tax=Geoalkalibacter halelectricus TaxID=2847045 RepID=A0ABY5ZT32_9BACT|nr:HD domain-containing phosphohydrolase [Geoalkalibacter halelectricus]MDO3377417.1 response regulator [Geoalkalibacter halelectricus]UWZ80824.1 response regulator [Geoalkalibacter halelectricus]